METRLGQRNGPRPDNHAVEAWEIYRQYRQEEKLGDQVPSFWENLVNLPGTMGVGWGWSYIPKIAVTDEDQISFVGGVMTSDLDGNGNCGSQRVMGNWDPRDNTYELK
jgi:hypothetical protein